MTEDRFYGWVFGDTARDRALLALYLSYKEQGFNFAEYVKDLIYKHQNGDLVEAGNSFEQQILHKLNEIERLIRSGAIHTQGKAVQAGTDDQEVFDLLSDIGT